MPGCLVISAAARRARRRDRPGRSHVRRRLAKRQNHALDFGVNGLLTQIEFSNPVALVVEIVVERALDARVRVGRDNRVRAFPVPLAHETSGQAELHLVVDGSDIANVDDSRVRVVHVIQPDGGVLPRQAVHPAWSRKSRSCLVGPDLLKPDGARERRAVSRVFPVEIAAEPESHLLLVLFEQPIAAAIRDAEAVERAALGKVQRIDTCRRESGWQSATGDGAAASTVMAELALTSHSRSVITVGGQILLGVGEVLHREHTHCREQ